MSSIIFPAAIISICMLVCFPRLSLPKRLEDHSRFLSVTRSEPSLSGAWSLWGRDCGQRDRDRQTLVESWSRVSRSTLQLRRRQKESRPIWAISTVLFGVSFLPFNPNHTADNLQVETVETGSDIHAAVDSSVSQAVSGKWLHVSDNAPNINGTSLQLSADTECGKYGRVAPVCVCVCVCPPAPTKLRPAEE